MKAVSARRVVRFLGSLGFRKASRGNGTGHAVWEDAGGPRVSRVLRHGDDLPLAYLFALGTELESKLVRTRREIWAAVRV